MVENVSEFATWTLYPAWLDAMSRLGYVVSPHIVDAADHGVPQHRVRLFLVCTRSKAPMILDLPTRQHASINEVIDWSYPDWSRIDKPGRSAATLRRIASGRARFGDRFVAPYYGTGSGTTGRSIHRPIGTITTRDRWSIIDGNRMRMLQPQEAKLAMGFPASYRIPKERQPAIHLLGNAVSPIVATDIFTEIRRTI